MKVAIHQPHYLPWAGYLDKVDRADAFVLLDTVAFSKGDWQNRNRFKTAQGWQWVTVPVLHESGQLIEEVRIDPRQHSWARSHRQALRTNYGATPWYEWTAEGLEAIWQQEWELLAPLGRATLEWFMERMGLTPPLHWAHAMDPAPDHPDERLIYLCRQLGADTYLAGPEGPEYMEMDRWEAAGIEVEVQDFTHPEYDQPFGDFLPGMSAVDLLCNCGPRSLDLLREANGRGRPAKGESG